MKKDEMFTRRLQADIALIEAQLTRFKVRGMGFTAGAKDRNDEIVDQLEQKIDRINLRLSELEKAEGQQWTDSKDRIEDNLRELESAFQEAVKTFTTEPGLSDEHGNDEGPYPYGKGLSGRSADK